MKRTHAICDIGTPTREINRKELERARGGGLLQIFFSRPKSVVGFGCQGMCLDGVTTMRDAKVDPIDFSAS